MKKSGNLGQTLPIPLSQADIPTYQVTLLNGRFHVTRPEGNSSRNAQDLVKGVMLVYSARRAIIGSTFVARRAGR